jgi:hypothetical protein
MDDKTSQRLDTIARELDRRRQEHGAGTTRSRTLRRIFRKVVMLVALVFFVLAGIFIFNFLRLNSDLVEGHIKQGIIPNLTQGKFELNIGSVSGNLINGVELENVLIQNPHFKTSATVMTIPRISMQYSLLNIFWGSITLEKLLIENPVLTLKRNENGRGIWDFSVPANSLSSSTRVLTNGSDNSENEQSLTTWQKQEQAQALADNYLSDIKVRNLSILVPSPDQLITDEFLSRLTRFPKKTYQYTGIDLVLKKYPAEKFISHIFSISVPDDPEFLRFQFTRMKSTGNFTLSFDAIGQNFNLAVENLGLDGRKINFYDGRMKDRLNLELTLARGSMSLLEKIRELNGVLRVPDFNAIFREFLSKDSKIEGSLDLKVTTEPGKSLYDSNVLINLADAALKIPFVPVIQKLEAELTTAHRVAELKRVNVKIKDIESSHKGTIDYSDTANIHGRIDSNVMGDEMQLRGAYKRENPGLHRLEVALKRNSGEAFIDFKRHLLGKSIIYRDFNMQAGLVKDGKAVDILPLNLLPKSLSGQILSWFERVDLVGPFVAKTSFKTLDDWKSSSLDIDFSGSKIVNKLNPLDSVVLDGRARLASGVFALEGLKAEVDEFSLVAAGELDIATHSPFITDYKLELNGGVKPNKSFEITAERLQKSLGMKYRPDFDKIELVGQKIISASISSQAKENSIELDIEKIRFVRRKKPLWCDKLKMSLITDQFNTFTKELPGPVKADLSGEIFGIPVECNLQANVASGSIDQLSFKGGGSNFSKILEAVISQPEGSRFFKKYPMSISGAFNFAFLGKGLLEKPSLDGWIKFPSLSFSHRDTRAKLPFHAMIKTSQNNYVADINTGAASIKVGNVTFDLGKTSAKAEIQDLFVARDPSIKFEADSTVFAADFKAIGSIKLNSKKIDSMNVSLKSSRIETLAKEIARIGRFKIPFDLSGRFSANAQLSGSAYAPDSHGSVEVTRIGLDFPLFALDKSAVLKARDFSGKAHFSKRGKNFSVDLKKLKGRLIDAQVELDGIAHLRQKQNGLKPEIEQLNAQLSGLKLSTLAGYLIKNFLPAGYAKNIKVASGEVFGKFTLSGNPERMVAIGEAVVNDASLEYKALQDSFDNFNCTLKFEGRSDSAYARIGIENASARFGRSRFKINQGYLEDPLRSGALHLEGAVEKVYPTDLLAMMGGMKIDALSFPEEGWLDGRLLLDGTLFAPKMRSQIKSSSMKVAYDSGSAVYTIPIGENLVDFSYNPGTGDLHLNQAVLRLLNGKIALEEGSGKFASGEPFTFQLAGNLEGIDVSKLHISDAESFRGLIGGKLRANWETGGARDAVFNLEFKDIFIPKIPVVDPNSVSKVGIEFIEKPDFRVGQLNFYVTTEEDADYAGKLLVADGLFAGPHMRLELGNSEFNPAAMSLRGKLMLNPQSLRKTTLGQKLKKLSATIQDKKTGIPYVDLNLSGTWDKPELMARSLQKTTERRAKKNFVRKIFSRGPHKASVEELMHWFPGWKKGM